MVSETYNIKPFICESGVDKENTELASQRYVNTNRIRFVDGLPETIGGWESLTFDDDNTVGGCARMIYSQDVSNLVWYLIGTHTRLYSLANSQLTNITPVVTATTAIANSIDTHFFSLGSNPLTTDNLSSIVYIAITGIHNSAEVGDIIEIAGAADTNGILAATLNGNHTLRTVNTNLISIDVGAGNEATSSGTGGGGSITVGTGVLTIAATGHGQVDGDRVKIQGATATGGIGAGLINIEHIIRGSVTNAFDIYISTEQATSPVSAGGGAGTTFQPQIEAGVCDAASGIGYGAGLYGSGLYSSALTSDSTNILPRVWSACPFGNLIITTAGQDGDIYGWDADISEAPVKLANSPTANYVFQDRNIIVILGAGGTVNKVQWSDRGNETVWTASPANYAGSDELEGAGKLVSHASVRGENLLFTNEGVWLMQYLGLPNVWDFIPIEGSNGIIAQNARYSINGVVYWMGSQNFYIYSGGSVAELPCSIRDYVFDNLNWEQRSKCFAWYNEKFNEIWFFYPTTGDEPTNYAAFSLNGEGWFNGTITRTAFEYPNQLSETPYAINGGTMYQHEYGLDDDGNGLNWEFTTKYWSPMKDRVAIGGIIPDGIQIGDINIDIYTRQYSQDGNVRAEAYTCTATESKVDFYTSGREWQYRFSQNVVGGKFRMGMYREYIKGGTPE